MADLDLHEGAETGPGEEARRLAARLSLWQLLHRISRQLIYQVVMRGGGAPFGAPFERGLQTLTEPVVRRFAQHGFFAFEAHETVPERARRNKFTLHGSAPFRGPYRGGPGALAARPRPLRLFARILRRRR